MIPSRFDLLGFSFVREASIRPARRRRGIEESLGKPKGEPTGNPRRKPEGNKAGIERPTRRTRRISGGQSPDDFISKAVGRRERKNHFSGGLHTQKIQHEEELRKIERVFSPSGTKFGIVGFTERRCTAVWARRVRDQACVMN